MKLQEVLDFKKMDTKQLLAQYKRNLAGPDTGYEGMYSRATVKKMEKEFAASQAAMKKELGTRENVVTSKIEKKKMRQDKAKQQRNR
jgi:predicted Ser/Thr protein kinase